MSKFQTLAMLDDAIGQAEWPMAVPPLPLDTGGVDPLGLRQLNFQLMDRCIPGLNNAAWRLRPYVVMAWSWWQLARIAERDAQERVSTQLARKFVDRIEVLFQAGQLVDGSFDSLPGRDAINDRIVTKGGYDFSSSDWNTWHMSRRGQGSLMAPVSYGPSVKEGLGLGFLRSSEGMFAPVDEAIPAILALDARLQPALHHDAFNSFECGWVSLAEMASWRKLWYLDELSEAEVSVGRAALHGTGGSLARSATLELLQSILSERGTALDPGELRLLGARSDQSWSPTATAQVWRALQTRQLFRLSLEGLLNWLLYQAAQEPTPLDVLAGSLMDAIADDDDVSFGAWMNKDCYATDGENGIVSPVALLNDIDRSDQAAAPERSAVGLRAAVQICREMNEVDDLFGGQTDRLPLRLVSQRIRSAANLSMHEACELVISELLIGQHVYWAVGRSGDDTQRLRIVLDDGGWIALRQAGHANPTPDRLASLLSLAADCQMLERGPDGSYRSLQSS